MSYMPSAKKRRLDGPAALRKPFRSPLKRENSSKDGPTHKLSQLSQVETPPSSSPGNAKSEAEPSVAEPAKEPSASDHSTGPSLRTKTSSSHLNDIDIYELQLRARELESKLRTYRNDIDTLKQAIAIKNGGKDAKLTRLRNKWKEMSQSAAEENFATSRDRVNQMGGVGAWRERERESRSFAESWNQEQNTTRPDVDDVGSTTYYHDREEEHVDETEGESFTLAMMLRALNIDLDTIGYDPVNEQWVN
jgi:hypothetical protein